MEKLYPSVNLKRWITVSIAFFFLSFQLLQAQTISGSVFLDGNNNGIKDATESGFPFVTVKAYDASNTAVATAVTLSTPSADIGKYTLSSGLTAGTKYRIEFSIPNGYNTGAFSGNGSLSSIQFVTEGATNVNLGIFVPGECLANSNPALVFGCALFAFSGDTPGLASYLYGDKTVITTPNAPMVTHTDDALASEVGVPFAMGFKSTSKNVFFTSVTATNTFGYLPPSPDGPSAIYIADYSGTSGARVGNAFGSKKLLMKLTDVAAIDVSNQFPIANDTPQDGIDDLTKNTAFGLSGLGGIDVSDDGQKLYVINMGNGSLVKIDISGVNYASLPATKPTTATTITIPTSVTSCTNGRFRPSVVKILGNTAYIAGVCDASTSTAAGDGTYPNLNVIVLAMDLMTETFTKAFEFAPSFKVGSLSSNIVTNQIKWGWYQQFTAAPFQPFVADIAFDDEGAIIIGMINRKVYGEISNNDLGYLVRAARTATGWQLENAGTTGAYTTQATTNNTGPGNSYDILTGPGDKWFFEQGLNDQSVSGGSRHRFLFSGGVFVLPNSGEVVAGYTDPEWIGTFGTRYLDLKTGKTKAYANIGGQKVFAITSTEAVCEANPIEIGNRVWKDTNSNGIQDPDEPGLKGVTVTICSKGSTTPIATAITDDNGNYIFSTATGTSTTSLLYGLNLNFNTEYDVKLTALGSDPSVTGLTLANLSIAPGEISGAVNTGTTLANNDAFLVASVPTAMIKIGNPGENNHSYDFGFTASCVKPTAITLAKTVPTCTGATANNDGKITLTSATGADKCGISTLGAATYDGPAYATATAYSANKDVKTAIPNTGGTYILRLFNGADDCFKDTTITVVPKFCFVQGPIACGMLIDSLTAVQNSTLTGRVSSVQSSSILLGGERDMNFITNAPTDISGAGTKFEVGPFFSGGNVIEIANQAAASSTLMIQWDGLDGDPVNLNPTGLGGLDFTTLGINRLKAKLEADFPPATNDSLQIRLELYTNAGAASRITKNFKFPSTTFNDIEFKFSDLVPFAGSGVDLSNIGAVTMFINMEPNAVSTRTGWDVVLKDISLECPDCVAPVAAVGPKTQTVCVGGTATAFTATPSTGVEYKWYGPLTSVTASLGTALAGQTAASFTPTGAVLTTEGTKYYAVVVNTTGDATCADTAFVTLNVSKVTVPAATAQCHANGTPEDASDDYMTFTIKVTDTPASLHTYTVTATQGGNPLAVTLSNGTPATAVNCGLNTPLRTPAGSAGKGNVTLTITNNVTGCSTTLTITDPGTCAVVCVSGTPSTVVYEYGTQVNITDLDKLPIVIPQFDQKGGTRVLQSVKLEYTFGGKTAFVFENRAAQSQTFEATGTSKAYIELNGSNIDTSAVAMPIPETTLPGGILVPAQGSWPGDTVQGSTPTTLGRMANWVSDYLSLCKDPRVDARWVTNATGDATDDDDMYVAPMVEGAESGSLTYNTTATLAPFIGTGLVPLNVSTESGLSLAGGGGNIFAIQRTRAFATAKVTYTFECVVLCTPPTRTVAATDPTCTTAGKIELTATNGDKYGVSKGATYTGPAYAAATAVGTLPIAIKSNISHTADSTWTIRVFNGANDCFKDTTVTVKALVKDATISVNNGFPVCRLNGTAYTIKFTKSPSGAVVTAKNVATGAAIAVTGDSVASIPLTVAQVRLIVTNGVCKDSVDVTAPVCDKPVGSIGDLIWKDSDDNGVQNLPGEKGVAGVKVNLYAAAGGTKTGSVLQTKTTGTDGLYLFTGLMAGAYIVEIDKTSLPDTCQITTKQNIPSDDTKDSDFNPTSGLSQVITLNPVFNPVTQAELLATNNLTVDAGLVVPCVKSKVTVTAAPVCSADVQTYSLTFSLTGKNGIIKVNKGTLTGSNPYTVTGIPSGASITITDSLSAICKSDTVITGPNCNCNPSLPMLLTPSLTACIGDTFPTLKATVVGMATVEWFTVATGGAAVASGLDYKPTGIVMGDTVFYAQARSTDPACPAAISTSRVPATINAQDCTKEVDLALRKSINTKIAQIGDILTYTLKVWNESNTNATGVEVTDSIATTVQFQVGSFVPSRGTAILTGNVIKWAIGGIAANGDTVTLTYQVKATQEGVHFNTAEICKTNEKDVDSTPCNHKDDEDDIDRQCFTVPVKLCPGEKAEANVPNALTNVQWFKDGGSTAIATGNVVLLTEVGTYTFTATNQACPANGCCPVIIEAGVNCCSEDLCIPFTIKKTKKK